MSKIVICEYCGEPFEKHLNEQCCAQCYLKANKINKQIENGTFYVQPPRQYCRYCAHAVVTTQDTCWCEELKKDIPESTAKAKNACKSFSFLERDAYDPTRIYRPERRRIDNDQTDLFSEA